jgi:Ca-activated chloride channel family protein
MKVNRSLATAIVELAAVALFWIVIGFLSGCSSASPSSYKREFDAAVAETSSSYSSTTNSSPASIGTLTGVYTEPNLRPRLRGFGGRPAAVRPISNIASASLTSDEVWIIARSTAADQPSGEAAPGSGELVAKVDQQEIPMPLKHTDVKASVSGYIGAVDVTQQFLNPYDRKIEAVYVFPLPHNAAVNEFLMTIGDRRIRGIIRERKEAEQIYQVAKRQGYVASLLTEERQNVFSQSVANIEPGKEIYVNIKYFHTLEYVDGWYEFVFPMVVGPRYNPAGMTNGVGAVPLGGHGTSGQATEVQYLNPNQRTGHDISLRVDVDAGVTIEGFECKTHAITKEQSTPEHLIVSLDENDRVPNRDFVLRYRVAGGTIKSSLLTQRDPMSRDAGYFTLMLYPPQELGNLERQPLELVFVLDCSGSMSGRPIEQAKAAVARGLRLLSPGDSFQLINFSTTASQLGPAPLLATPENIRRGLNYLNSLNGDGGTEMIEGIKAALDYPHDPERLRFVCFLTDGYIGNETEILAAIHQKLGASRIFSFGIGTAVNRYLIDHMGKTGRGAVAYLGLHDDAAKIMEDFFERISHPAMTDLKIDWGGMQVEEVFPRELPDLFVGRPVILTGRFKGSSDAAIRVSGSAAGTPMQLNVSADPSNPSATHKALPLVWARMKIAELANQSTYAPDAELPDAIKRVALDYGLMSAFTAFVAVDSSRVTEGNEGTTVPVAVPVPEGVNYDTTVPEK